MLLLLPSPPLSVCCSCHGEVVGAASQPPAPYTPYVCACSSSKTTCSCRCSKQRCRGFMQPRAQRRASSYQSLQNAKKGWHTLCVYHPLHTYMQGGFLCVGGEGVVVGSLLGCLEEWGSGLCGLSSLYWPVPV